MHDIATHWHAHGCTPHATAWHGGMAGAPAGRGGEMHPVFPSCFPSPLFPPLLPLFFSPWFLGVHPAPLFSPAPASSPSFLLLVWLRNQSYCSVCHCLIVILTTHSHGVLLSPFSLSLSLLPQHTSRLRLDARLHPHG